MLLAPFICCWGCCCCCGGDVGGDAREVGMKTSSGLNIMGETTVCWIVSDLGHQPVVPYRHPCVLLFQGASYSFFASDFPSLIFSNSSQSSLLRISVLLIPLPFNWFSTSSTSTFVSASPHPYSSNHHPVTPHPPYPSSLSPSVSTAFFILLL